MDAWLYFPGLKVGQIHLYILPFSYLVALIGNRYIGQKAIILELDSRLGLLSLAVLCCLNQG
jgi:hypothetical protein